MRMFRLPPYSPYHRVRPPGALGKLNRRFTLFVLMSLPALPARLSASISARPLLVVVPLLQVNGSTVIDTPASVNVSPTVYCVPGSCSSNSTQQTSRG